MSDNTVDMALLTEGEGVRLLVAEMDTPMLTEAVEVGLGEGVLDTDDVNEEVGLRLGVGVPLLDRVELADAVSDGATELLGDWLGVGKGVGLSTPHGPLMASSQGGRVTPRSSLFCPPDAMGARVPLPATCLSR